MDCSQDYLYRLNSQFSCNSSAYCQTVPVPRCSLESLALQFYSFDFIQRDLILGAIVLLGGTGRLMRGDLLGVLQGATILQIRGNSGRAKSMTAGGVGQCSSLGPPLDHVEHVAARHRIGSQLVALFEAAE